MDECAILFTITSRTKFNHSDCVLKCVLNRDKDAPYELEIKYHKGYENSSAEKQDEYLTNILQENNEMYLTITNDPRDCLKKVLMWRGMSMKALAKKISMSPKQMERILVVKQIA